MYTYILCEFEYGYTGQLYQEVLNGNVIRLLDLDGNEFDLISNGTPYGYHVINDNPGTPTWGLTN